MVSANQCLPKYVVLSLSVSVDCFPEDCRHGDEENHVYRKHLRNVSYHLNTCLLRLSIIVTRKGYLKSILEPR